MTDVQPTPTTPPVVPSVISNLVHDYSQKALTAVSVWIMTTGAAHYINLISSAKGETTTALLDSAIQVGVGVAAFGASCAWTYVVAYLRKKKMTELFNFIPKENT